MSAKDEDTEILALIKSLPKEDKPGMIENLRAMKKLKAVETNPVTVESPPASQITSPSTPPRPKETSPEPEVSRTWSGLMDKKDVETIEQLETAKANIMAEMFTPLAMSYAKLVEFAPIIDHDNVAAKLPNHKPAYKQYSMGNARLVFYEYKAKFRKGVNADAYPEIAKMVAVVNSPLLDRNPIERKRLHDNFVQDAHNDMFDYVNKYVQRNYEREKQKLCTKTIEVFPQGEEIKRHETIIKKLTSNVEHLEARHNIMIYRLPYMGEKKTDDENVISFMQKAAPELPPEKVRGMIKNITRHEFKANERDVRFHMVTFKPNCDRMDYYKKVKHIPGKQRQIVLARSKSEREKRKGVYAICDKRNADRKPEEKILKWYARPFGGGAYLGIDYEHERAIKTREETPDWGSLSHDLRIQKLKVFQMFQEMQKKVKEDENANHFGTKVQPLRPITAGTVEDIERQMRLDSGGFV